MSRKRSAGRSCASAAYPRGPRQHPHLGAPRTGGGPRKPAPGVSSCSREFRPRQRLEDRPTQLLTAARSQHIRVVRDRRAMGLVSTRFARLPPGIEFSPARLTIEFYSAEDFLEKFESRGVRPPKRL